MAHKRKSLGGQDRGFFYERLHVSMHERASQTMESLSRQVYPTAAEVAERLGGKYNRKGYWMALCPAHKDTDPSLQLWDSDDGPAFKCYAGCTDKDIREAIEAVGLGLWVQHESRPQSQAQPVQKIKNINEGSPDSLDSPDKKVVIEHFNHVYRDEEGYAVARVVRVKYGDGRKTFIQQRPAGNGGWLNGLGGIEPPLYNLPKVLKAIEADIPIYIVEGEKCVDVLDSLGAIATTNPMGAGKWKPHHTEALKGSRIIILPDNDRPGKAHAEHVAEMLKPVAKSVKVAHLNDLPDKGDVLDWLERGRGIEELPIVADSTPIWVPGIGAWEEPIPFNEPNLPEFPVTALPKGLRQWVMEEAEATQTPPDLAAMIALSVIAAACQKKVRIKVWDGYEEPLNIYTAIVMPPGSRKSAVMTDATKVIREYETRLADLMGNDVARAESRLRRMEKKLRLAEERVAKEGKEINAGAPATPDTLDRETDELAIEVEALRKALPVLPRIVADDVTPEKVVQLMAEQSGRISVFSAEGGIFETMAGRYSGSVPNIDAFLKAHSGEDIITDRLTRSGNHVKGAALTLCLAIQPDVIRTLADHRSFRGRGLTARFLYSMPHNRVGKRKTRPAPVPASTQTTYERTVKGLLEIEAKENGRPHLLRLSPEAQGELEFFAEWIETMLVTTGELGYMADWGGKLVGAIVRVAGLLHMARMTEKGQDPFSTAIDKVRLTRTLWIGEYLMNHAQAAYGEMGADHRFDDAEYLWHWIASAKKSEMPKQEIWQGTRRRFKKANVLDDALCLLCERGYLREREVERKSKWGRKPAPVYEVNPLCRDGSRAL